MKSSIIISIVLMAVPFTASAGGIGNIFAGFTNGVNQTQQRNYDEQGTAETHYLTKEMVNELSAQYSKCLDSVDDTFLEPVKSFTSVIAQSNQCIASANSDYWQHTPDSPIAWVGKGTPDAASKNLRATKSESYNFLVLMRMRRGCVQPVLNYNGSRDTYVSRLFRAFKRRENGYETLTNKFIDGEVNRGEFDKLIPSIGNEYETSLNRISNDVQIAIPAHVSASIDERSKYCAAEQESQKQAIYNDEETQALSQQHRRIEDLDEQNQAAKQALIASQRKLQQAKEEAAEAERKEQEAEGEAERQQQASYK